MFPDTNVPALEHRYYCIGRELKLDGCECLYSPLDKYVSVSLGSVGDSGVTWYKISLRADCIMHNIDGVEFSYHVY
jgi:hypothetical protein